MSIRNLDSLFAPRSVAVIGASDRPASVGATVWHNLREGRFSGARWAVNPRRASIGGESAFASVAALPEAPELAILCTPAASVPGLIAQLGQRGTRAAIVLSAGLDASHKRAMLEAARPHVLRILGPNCLGLLSTPAGLNASFAQAGAAAGGLAFVSQSGAVVTAMLDWANGRGIGFSHCISLGEHADVDFGDLIDWLASDPDTRAILLYIEALESTRKFMSAARAAARNKPVIFVKAGRSPHGQAAAASHTGALAGADWVYDAALRRAGMLRVTTMEDLFVAAETLARFKEAGSLVAPEAGEGTTQLTILTNGGGVGVMAADAAADAGVELAPLGPSLQQALDATLPAHWSHANPIDIIGDAPVLRYEQTLRSLLATPGSGMLLLIHAPTAIVPATEIATALLPLARSAGGRLLSCWLGGPSVDAARKLFREAGVPDYDTPEQAVRALAMLRDYRQGQRLLSQVPAMRRPGAGHDLARVSDCITQVLAQGRELLSEAEAKEVLAAVGVPVVRTLLVAPNGPAAAAAARELGFPAVLKLVSPQISHKSDVGGVALDLPDEAATLAAAQAMLQRVARERPQASVTGFTVQPMVRRPRALELIVGATVDPQFGPVLLFGQGGTAVEVVADRAVALPPLNAPLARDLIGRTRIDKLLHGWRDVPPADLDAVIDTLIVISELLAAEPRIAELDINPLLADAAGVVALDARIRVSAAAPGGAAHFAILPYPAELVETLAWNGESITLRPIRPEDNAQHLAFLQRLDPLDVRLRVFHSRRYIGPAELARLTQIDYEREMAFIATATSPQGGEETLGIARALADPDNHSAEFGVIVRSDLKGGGLGELLMRRLITHLRQRGTTCLVGSVLRENHRMLQLAQMLGFEIDDDPLDKDLRAVRLALQPSAAPAAHAGAARGMPG